MEAPAKVECPQCHHSNAPGVSRCSACQSVLHDPDATVVNDATMITNAAVATNWSRNTGSGGSFDGPGMSLQEGSILAERYEILKLLGEGGMGAVYKAQDRELDRLVALKVIRPELAGHASILQRFKQELILARKITHRNIIRIFDLGVADGIRFITMEFVEGQDLASLIDEREKYSPEETVKILRQVCAALEAAHAEGVVHRDLKPQNIMLEASGRVCVMDFGLARSMETTGMTQAGTVMGTPAYMSPEQAKGMPADERSDLYSLGIIAYQMLTGKVPFKADSALASMLLRTQGPPTPAIQIDPTIPQPLSDLIQKSLAVDPQDRYQSAALMGQDLLDWQEGTLAKAIVTPRVAMMAESSTKKWIALAVGCAALLAAGGYGVTRWLEQAPRSHVADDRAYRRFQQSHWRPGVLRHAGVHAQAGVRRRFFHQRVRSHENAGSGFEAHSGRPGRLEGSTNCQQPRFECGGFRLHRPQRQRLPGGGESHSDAHWQNHRQRRRDCG